MKNEMPTLLEQEVKIRAEITEKVKELLSIQERIQNSAIQKDREHRFDPLYHEVRITSGAFLIRMKRCYQITKSLLGTMASMSLPPYKDISVLIDEKKREIEKKEKLREKVRQRQTPSPSQSSRNSESE